ncbi:MAG: tyrosine-type recombinase/integrase [Oscillospiraceae bacterium]|nr:tyrosine-type recombinase/integrase [Oscillospiraceae bacterium]
MEIIAAITITEYETELKREEKSSATIEKYLRYAKAFLLSLGGDTLTKDAVITWKQAVTARYTAAGANGMITAVNSFLKFLGRTDLRVMQLRVRRICIVRPERELCRRDLERLLSAAERKGKASLSLVMRTMFATGIRVSELRYITVESARAKEAEIRLKGKIRTILLPKKLCVRLLRHAMEGKITSGAIFLSRGGKPLDRFSVWRGMKLLGAAAGVAKSKVFPHNLRRLFARTFYHFTRNLAELADVLGHSDINTTRIYTAATGAQLRRRLDSPCFLL